MSVSRAGLTYRGAASRYFSRDLRFFSAGCAPNLLRARRVICPKFSLQLVGLKPPEGQAGSRSQGLQGAPGLRGLGRSVKVVDADALHRREHPFLNFVLRNPLAEQERSKCRKKLLFLHGASRAPSEEEVAGALADSEQLVEVLHHLVVVNDVRRGEVGVRLQMAHEVGKGNCST